MAKLLTYEAVKAKIEAGYPLPIAAVFRKCRTTDQDDLGSRHKAAIDLFEVFLKFTCIVQLQDARRSFRHLKELLPEKEHSLDFLKSPALGHWLTLLDQLSALDLSGPEPVLWTTRIAEWYKTARSSEHSQALTLLQSLAPTLAKLELKSDSLRPIRELCTAFVTYRNKELAHSATLPHNEIARRLPLLEHLVCYLLSSASFLAAMYPMCVTEIKLSPDGRYLVQGAGLRGSHDEPVRYESVDKLEHFQLYVMDVPSGNVAGTQLSLGPFVLWTWTEGHKSNEVYFYNTAWHTKLEYLAYVTGEKHYHKELHSAFADLVQLKLKPGVAEDPHAGLTPEARAQHAERLFKHALFALEKDRLEEAVEYLEEATQYEPRAERFFLLAEARRKLGDDPAAVLHLLEECLELEPGHEGALAFRQELERVGEDSEDAKGTIAASELVSARIEVPMSICDALLPRMLRDYTSLIAPFAMVAWYGVSAAFEVAGGHAEYLLPLGLKCCFCIIVLAGIVADTKLVSRMHLPLSLQLDSMRAERFSGWFQAHLTLMFGKFSHKRRDILWKETIKAEPTFYIGLALFVFVLVVASLLLSVNISTIGILLTAKRAIDFAVLYGVAYWGVRMATGFVIFVKQYSELSLKPMLTTLNDEGLRSFGPVLTFKSSLLTGCYVSFWTLSSLVVHLPFYWDFVFLGIASGLAMILSVGGPLMIRGAARDAKRRASHQYSAHIEEAFLQFLDTPSEETVARYRWLVDGQNVIRRIGTWPLTGMQTAISVIGTNLVLIGIDALYVWVRMTRKW